MKSHRTDGVSLGFGLLFLVIAIWWLVARYVAVDIPNLGWIVAAGLIILGITGVIGSLFGRRDEPREEPRDQPPAPPAVTDRTEDVDTLPQ